MDLFILPDTVLQSFLECIRNNELPSKSLSSKLGYVKYAGLSDSTFHFGEKYSREQNLAIVEALSTATKWDTFIFYGWWNIMCDLRKYTELLCNREKIRLALPLSTGVVSDFFTQMENNTAVKHLEFIHNMSPTIKSFISFAKNNTTLESINLSFIQQYQASDDKYLLSSDYILAFIENNTSVKELNISTNEITNDFLFKLGNLLSANTNLIKLTMTGENFSMNNLQYDNVGIQALCKGLEENYTLTSLTVITEPHHTFYDEFRELVQKGTRLQEVIGVSGITELIQNKLRMMKTKKAL